MNIRDLIQGLLSRWKGQEPQQVEQNTVLGPEQLNPYMNYEQQQAHPEMALGPNTTPLNINNYSSSGFSSPDEYLTAIRNGDVYSSLEDPKAFGIKQQVLGAQDNAQAPTSYDRILKYATKYKNSSGYKSRMTPEYLGLMWNEINRQFPKASPKQMENLLANIVAMSLTETGMGAAKANADPNSPYYRQSNFWGWFKGGDRGYDPSQPEMAKEIVRGLGSGYNLINQDMNKNMAVTYSGNDRADRWLRDYQAALQELGYLN